MRCTDVILAQERGFAGKPPTPMASEGSLGYVEAVGIPDVATDLRERLVTCVDGAWYPI